MTLYKSKTDFSHQKTRGSPVGKNLDAYMAGYDPYTQTWRPPPERYKLNKKALEALRAIASPPPSNNIEGPVKLIDIGFDPIDELVCQLDEYKKLLKKELAAAQPRATVINNLITIQERIAAALLKYRYREAGAVSQESTDQAEPIRIILSHDSTRNEIT
jgi:hypothetical protein